MVASIRVKTPPSSKGIADMPSLVRAAVVSKPRLFASVWGAAQLLCQRFGAMRQAMSGRRALARMDARMLADIGLSQSEAAFEMNRKPWDTAPLERRQ